YCQSLAQKPHEQKKIELVKRLLKRDGSCIIGDYLTALSKTTRQQLEQWSLGRKSSTGKDMFTAPIGEWVEGYRDFLIMLAKQELNIFLQMKPRTEKVDTLETVFRKYHPENYDKVFSGGPYTIEATRNGHLIKQAALATQQSCIRQEALEFFEEDAADPGTRYHIAKRKGKLMGYVRTFFMRNNKGQLVTAIDTMEVPHKDFEKHTTLLSAMALGTILFSFDSGASSVIGKEGRIKYVRESFSNASKHVSLTKTGRLDEVWHYEFQWSRDGNVSADAYLLMTNWKV
ncbi:hypothetical protein HY639_05730, partial [Candidatus Woesearchaeota archaeon]|nr:hypothetical protein [Candidatus Woesearchaeota archaeon]